MIGHLLIVIKTLLLLPEVAANFSYPCGLLSLQFKEMDGIGHEYEGFDRMIG